MRGNLVIVSAPSGGGKTTILAEVIRRVDRVAFSISHTTRQPRTGERSGRDYHFTDRHTFTRMIEDGAFLEWAEVHGHFYGTALAQLRDKLDSGVDVLLDIDVQGAAIIRESARVEAIDVFILPPDRVELERRLRQRSTESEEDVSRRLATGIEEMGQSGLYDFLIVNDDLEDAVTLMCAIIFAERARGRRRIDGRAIAGPAGP